MEKNQKSTGIKTLRVIARLSLIAGIFGGIALFMQIVDNTNTPQALKDNTLLIYGGISGIVFWAFFSVICTIAETLLEIREKLCPENLNKVN